MKRTWVNLGHAPRNIVLLVLVAVLALVTSQRTLFAESDGGAGVLLRDPHGKPVGTAKLTQEIGVVLVRATVHGLPPGFHGFHVHATGTCVAPAFTSAGGHFNPGSVSHASHAGDMPVLYVTSDGTGEARFKTDRFALADLFDADGSALIIHALPDNYANIPQRYGVTPDTLTLATGDAGGRIACGVVENKE